MPVVRIEGQEKLKILLRSAHRGYGTHDALVKTAMKSGDMRQDLERADWRLQRVSWRYRAVRGR